MTDNHGVQVVRLNGQPVPLVDGAFSGSVAVGQDGPVSITVCATDLAGNVALQVVTGTYDTRPPILTVSSPAEGALFAMDPIDVTGTVLDVTKVTVSVNGVAATVTGSWFTARVPLVQNVNALNIQAVDAASNTTSTVRHVTLDLDRPSITIVSPANGARITTGTPEIVVTYHNGTSGIAPESFTAMLDGQPLTGMTVTESEARLRIPSSRPLSAGLHVLDVSVSDRVGRSNGATSAFTLFSGPEPPVVTPGSSFALGRVLEGSGTPLANVQVSVRGQTGALLTNGEGKYTFPAAESGEVLLKFSRPGYTYAHRRVKTVRGRETAVAPVYLIPRSPAVHVSAAQGGTVTDPGGRIVVTFPPGALPADADVQVTDLFASRVLPNYLPPESEYLSALDIEPSVTFNTPVHVSYRMRTTTAMPAGTPIPIGYYDPTCAGWHPAGQATVAGDGLHWEANLTHSSAYDINPPPDSKGSKPVTRDGSTSLGPPPPNPTATTDPVPTPTPTPTPPPPSGDG